MNLLRCNRPHFQILNVDNLKTCKDSLQMNNNNRHYKKKIINLFACYIKNVYTVFILFFNLIEFFTFNFFNQVT